MAEKTKIKKSKSSEIKKTAPEKKIKKKEKYFEGIGRRKSSIARVRLFASGKGVKINDKDLSDYFLLLGLQKKVIAPIEKTDMSENVSIVVKVKGGGMTGQAEAVRLGVSRALVKFNADFRKRLRHLGYLTRDARRVERKKFGLKKARRAPQWRKR